MNETQMLYYLLWNWDIHRVVEKASIYNGTNVLLVFHQDKLFCELARIL